MHQDIERAIELIDHKIIELQRAKRTLIEAFGEKSTQIAPSSGTTKITRKQTIIKLLQEEGPFTRSEILQKTNIPRGTVATVLNDKNVFRSKKGKWYLVESKEQEGQKEKGPAGSQQGP
jgi:hypothetical protein